MPRPIVTIVGAGKIGQAIGHFLQQSNTPPTLHFWDKDRTKVPEQLTLERILPAASFVFFCIPSWALKDALDETRPFIGKKTMILCVSKGIEPETQKTIDTLLKTYFPANEIALLLGPMLADEILRGLPGFATIATEKPRTVQQIRALFKKSHFELTDSPFVKDAAFASVLKNIYSLAMGLADGLEWGNNQKGMLASHAIIEMRALFQATRHHVEVLDTPAGLPDFLATAFSPVSRNRTLGEELIRTGKGSFQSEGSIALPSLVKTLKNKTSTFPILHAMRKILLQGKHKDAKELFSKLIHLS